MALMGFGIVLVILSPFTLAYDPSGLNRWLFAGLGTVLFLAGFVYEVADLYRSWRNYR